MTGYFDALPKSSLNMGKVLKWVQEGTNTFYRSVTLRGELFSANWVNNTSGWKLFPDGSAEFNGSVDVNGDITVGSSGSFSLGGSVPFGASTIFFIHSPLEHIILLETNGSDYPNDGLVLDINDDVGRIFWYDSWPNAVRALEIHQDGGLVVAQDGSAAAPSLRGDADETGFFFDTATLGVSAAGSEVARFTSEGLRGASIAGDNQDQTVSGISNTSYADLDALTGSAFSDPVIATRTTGTSALVIISAQIQQATAGTGLMSYRVSGASTIASSDTRAIRAQVAGGAQTSTYAAVLNGLTPGANVFEAQARVTGGTLTLINPAITVIPL